ncbi:hypothetical protein NM688_g5142 [Phlebia brevispora]|uniref:Uncharacterized protein n=1 Tax=Phlebia brevispora TaxID=194682 RepID=A0ACC1T068_9APHY|nr:hypothetical protein NM688_g5142 [Phlebia brevispora]
MRQKFRRQLQAILAWDKHYKAEEYKDQDVSVLSDDERFFVVNARDDFGDAMRLAYRSLVIGLSRLAIHHTWFSTQCAEVEDLLRIYFPSDEDDMPSYLFHHSLSAEEKKQLDKARKRCLSLLERYVRDIEAGRVVDPLTEEGRKAYPPPIEESVLVAHVLLYLERFEDAKEKIDTILNSAV